MTSAERYRARRAAYHHAFHESAGIPIRRCPDCGLPVWPLKSGKLPAHKTPAGGRYCSLRAQRGGGL